MNGFSPDVALLSLFARNAAAHPDLRAIADAGGSSFTYGEASNAVANLAQQIEDFGLPPRSSIVLLLPNGCELALALLAVMQSGHVAVPMPAAWRKSDLVRACREAEATVLITTAHFAPENLPQLAAEVAIEVFELSFPCAFGEPLADGIMPLALSATGDGKFQAAASQGIATMHPAPGGVAFVQHTDDELLAAGLGAMLSADMQSGDNIVSAVSLSNFAGLSSAFVPWLLSGGTLTLFADLSGAALAGADARTHLVAPVGAVKAICTSAGRQFASVAAVHFGGTNTAAELRDLPVWRVVDVTAFGETAVIALPRKDETLPPVLPLGALHAGNTGAGSPVILETQISETGTILLRGASVSKSAMNAQEWLDTGFTAVAASDSSFRARRPAELVAIGALRFHFPDLERRILAAALVSSVEVVDDPLLGHKLVIASERPAETAQALRDAGLPRVIANAVQKAETVRARSA